MYRAAALQEVTYKGQLYALPEFTNQITLIVNNDAARKAGVNVADIQTTNWKKLKQANKKLLKIDNGQPDPDRLRPEDPRVLPALGQVVRQGPDLEERPQGSAELA